MKIQTFTLGKQTTVILKQDNPVIDSKHAKMLKGYKTHLAKTGFMENSVFETAERFLAIWNMSSEGTLSYYLSTILVPFPKRDFERFGDKNNIKQVSRKWFSEHGLSLDVQLAVLNSNEAYLREVVMEDLIQHVMECRPGYYLPYGDKILKLIVSSFESEFGFKLTKSYAEFLVSL